MKQKPIHSTTPAVLARLDALAVGDGTHHDRMTVFPAFGEAASPPLGYVTLAEALVAGWIEVTEKPSATVPELLFRNRGQAIVFILDGEEIVGGKQNRIVNASFLIAPGAPVALPVSCVEQGRWHDAAPRFAPGEAGFFSLRREKQTHVALNLATTGRAVADQGAVWESVAERHVAAHSFSPTGAMHDIYSSQSAELASYGQAFPYVAGAVGLVVALNGRVSGAELFDRARTAETLWPKLVRSYALDAVQGPAAKPVSRERAIRLLARTRTARASVYPTLGLGEDVRLVGDGMVGAALVYRETPVHISLFRVCSDQQATTATGGIARASSRRAHRDVRPD